MSPFARTAALTLIAPVAYSLIEPHRLVVRRFTVVMQDLPRDLAGLRVVQLSDLHYSAITSPRIVRHAVMMCNAQRPDVVVLTGDYVSRRSSYSQLSLARLWARPVMEYAQEVAQEVAQLKAAEGIFAVPGNHDHSQRRFDAIERLLNGAGVITLVNRSVLLRGVLPLIGLDDLRGGRPLIRQACDGIAPDQPQVILSHNPRLLQSVAERRCLLLAGHTHGGQVRLPLTALRRRPSDMRGTAWYQGWYGLGRAQMYVSAGVGSVHFPMRFRCPPEIAVFTLVSGDARNYT
ncbi:MAG TPA: metallophosphoesterase [Abditibacteriaceae bacterium]|nr:metallophosphoesterase [Abditibacteriaceae bacterium]